jgi:serine protease Do
MKASLKHIAPLFGIVLLLPALAAGAAEDSPKETKREKKIIIHASAAGESTGGPRMELLEALPSGRQRMGFISEEPPEMETVTFLGVQTQPLDPTLYAQLGIATGTGLVVNEIVPESSAARVLQLHDILLKFNDQVLVNMDQLSVLVRNMKDGDKVTLTYVRGGQQNSAEVTLGQHEVPKRMTMQIFNAGPGMQWHGREQTMALAGGNKSADNLLWMMNVGRGDGTQRVVRKEVEGQDTVVVEINPGRSTMEFRDEAGVLEIVRKDGSKVLTAKDAEGKVIFNGPIDTEEEKSKLPPELRSRLDKIEVMPDFQFRTDENFKGVENKVIQRMGRGAKWEQPAKRDGLRRLDTF